MMQMTKEFRNVGPHTGCHTYLRGNVNALKRTRWRNGTYEPLTLPNCDTELMKARATARFAGGLGKVLLNHPKVTDMPAYD